MKSYGWRSREGLRYRPTKKPRANERQRGAKQRTSGLEGEHFRARLTNQHRRLQDVPLRSASAALESSPERRTAESNGQRFHHHEAGARKVLHLPLRDDVCAKRSCEARISRWAREPGR